MSEEGLIWEYLKYQDEYTQKYGEKTIVIMQVGNFYETFEYDPKLDKEVLKWPTYKIGIANEIASVLNICSSMKNNKLPYSLKNCTMVGFPVITYDRQKELLLRNYYTIVKIDQERSGKNVPRRVTQIISPATNIDNISTLPLTNNIISIYIEVLKEHVRLEEYGLIAGVSYIDVSTGENSVLETYSENGNNMNALQELYRFLTSLRPREIILHLRGKISLDYEEFLGNRLGLHNYNNVIFKTNEINTEFLKISYCTDFLDKLFNRKLVKILTKNSVNTSRNMENEIEKHLNSREANSEIISRTPPSRILDNLGLSRLYYGMVSYIVLLQYCYEHNPTLIEKINRPNISWLNIEEYLLLTHNAIDQLDLLPKNMNSQNNMRKTWGKKRNNLDSLFSVVNYTKTALGKRYLLNRLTQPITNVKKLEQIYDMTQILIENEELLSLLGKYLKTLPDLERYHRNLFLKKIKPSEFVILFNSYKTIVQIYTKLSEYPKLLENILNIKTGENIFSPTDFNTCLNLILGKYKLEILERCKIDGGKLIIRSEGEESNEKFDGMDESETGEKPDEMSDQLAHLYYPGVDGRADHYWQEYMKAQYIMDKIILTLNGLLSHTRGKKIVYNLKGEHTLTITAAKAREIKNYPKDICGELQFINVGKNVMITSDIISNTTNILTNTSEQLGKYLYNSYIADIEKITKYSFFTALNDFVSQLDYLCSNAICAIQNKYYKPVIRGNKSYLNAENLRHPLIEALIDKEYISNNIILGMENQPKGMLLYGLNSSGKSSFIKAIALNIILAQAGLFTAGKLEYFPFNRLITRLSGHDNIITGESSFIIEMKELKTILNSSDRNTLVIGDELSRASEALGGLLLSSAAILHLDETESMYVFSSHSHRLAEMKDIQKLHTDGKLLIKHLNVKYDIGTNTLIYNRKLDDGSGQKFYALEVARSLDLPQEFIEKAYSLKEEILGENKFFLSTKTSRYNSNVYLDSCSICGSREKLETHHIKQQKEADKNGFIADTHKDVASNLIALCEVCHNKLHSNRLKIRTTETSKGITLKIV